jgi:murein DD-endopeptidase MepM/ murein hydrolase activator NlpD
VRTPFGGKVTYSGDHGIYGGTVVIENRGWQVFFAHLSLALAGTGSIVEAGEAIGLSGNTGQYSTGPHVHFEIRECDPGTGTCTPRDPMGALLPGQGEFCAWESLGIGMTCSEYRSDRNNGCPKLP